MGEVLYAPYVVRAEVAASANVANAFFIGLSGEQTGFETCDGDRLTC